MFRGLSKYALFTKYSKMSVKKIPKKPMIRIGECGKSYVGIVMYFIVYNNIITDLW
jgi:hypothetical protein